LGDAACAAGTIGTGNGRSITPCGYEAPPPKKKDDTEVIVGVLGIAVIGLAAYYLHTNYDFEFRFDATDNWQSYGTSKSFELTDSLNFNTEISHTVTDSFNDNRILFSFSGTF